MHRYRVGGEVPYIEWGRANGLCDFQNSMMCSFFFANKRINKHKQKERMKEEERRNPVGGFFMFPFRHRLHQFHRHVSNFLDWGSHSVRTLFSVDIVMYTHRMLCKIWMFSVLHLVLNENDCILYTRWHASHSIMMICVEREPIAQ